MTGAHEPSADESKWSLSEDEDEEDEESESYKCLRAKITNFGPC